MDLIYTQLTFRPPKPTADFTSKTVIVTGANIGLGKEAVKHFVRLNAAKVIATARSLDRGKAALAEIEAETRRAGVAELWALDYSSYASVRQFCAKVAELERVDAVILNAGVGTPKFEIFEEDESTITVNVISTVLLMLLLLPTLRASATKWGIAPTLSVTGSAYHKSAKFSERDAPNSLEVLSDPNTANMAERYQVSKLLQIIAVREIAARTAKKNPFVLVNSVSPGLCSTDLTRNAEGATAFIMPIIMKLLAWTPEEGSRTLVHATIAGPESHGVLLSECSIKNNALASWIETAEGKKVQEKVWSELCAKLEHVQQGVMNNL